MQQDHDPQEGQDGEDHRLPVLSMQTLSDTT